MMTHVTRVTVTQTDDYVTPLDAITDPPGYRVWLVE